MLAVLAIALSAVKPVMRSHFVEDISVATTSWLVDESFFSKTNNKGSSFIHLMDLIADHFKVSLIGLSSGLHFRESNKKVLSDYEHGYVKEGVGAGALALLAQLNGATQEELVEACEDAVDQLQGSASK